MKPSAAASSRKRTEPWVGPWLKEIRVGREVDRAEIARRLGRHLSAVSRIETGASAIPSDDLPIVLRAYGATPAEYAAEARRVLRAA